MDSLGGGFQAASTQYGTSPAYIWGAHTGVSTQHNASVRFSRRQPADTLGVISAGAALVTSPVALTGNLQGSVQRWGDYSTVALDPVASSCGANRRAAVFNERIINSSTWGTQYGLIGFCP